VNCVKTVATMPNAMTPAGGMATVAVPANHVNASADGKAIAVSRAPKPVVMPSHVVTRTGHAKNA
jgi:hypothetical protein